MAAIYISGNYLIVDDDTKERQFPSKDFRYTRGTVDDVDTIEVFGIEPGLYENVKFAITTAGDWDDSGGTPYASLDALETVLQDNLAG